MHWLEPDGDRSTRDPVFESLADSRRRSVLSVLLDEAAPLDATTLATRVLAAERDVAPSTLTDEDVRAARADLRHARLPALVDAGLVVRDGTDETVTTTDHPVYDDPEFERAAGVDPGSEEWDAVFDCLATPRRRAVLSILAGRSRPMSWQDLARAVAARDPGREGAAGGVDDVLASLHHVDLPKLDAAGLVDTDLHARTAVYAGDARLASEFVGVEQGATLRAVVD